MGATTAVVLGSGVAYAATGGNFLLGKSNSETATAALSNSKGTPLSLVAPAGKAPLSVSNSVKVGGLNADLLDGMDSSALQGRVSGTCTSAISKIASNGSVTCQPAPVSVTSDTTGVQLNQWPQYFEAACPAGTTVTGGATTLEFFGNVIDPDGVARTTDALLAGTRIGNSLNVPAATAYEVWWTLGTAPAPTASSGNNATVHVEAVCS